ncbi:MAG: hypothetical protein SWZ49_27830 [Cyanobacteriota bacterium]|nr:hypothetical protein [Cyanobacteriota bacterium]
MLVHASRYDQAAYYLASHADEVYLHPMGEVLLEGYAMGIALLRADAQQR